MVICISCAWDLWLPWSAGSHIFWRPSGHNLPFSIISLMGFESCIFSDFFFFFLNVARLIYCLSWTRQLWLQFFILANLRLLGCIVSNKWREDLCCIYWGHGIRICFTLTNQRLNIATFRIRLFFFFFSFFL